MACGNGGAMNAMVIKSDYTLGQKIGGSNIHLVNCQITLTESNALQIGSKTVGNFGDVTWANIGVNAGSTGDLNFTDANAAGPTRFYRLVPPHR
jgi:hypothetical protein